MERGTFISLRALLLLLALAAAIHAIGSSELIFEAARDATLLLSYGD